MFVCQRELIKRDKITNVPPYVHLQGSTSHAIGLNGLSHGYTVHESSPMALYQISLDGRAAEQVLQFHHLVASKLCGIVAQEVRSLSGVAVEPSRGVAFILARTPTDLAIVTVALEPRAVTGHLTIPGAFAATSWDIALGGSRAHHRVYVGASSSLFMLERVGDCVARPGGGNTSQTQWCYDDIVEGDAKSFAWWWWVLAPLVLFAVIAAYRRFATRQKKYKGYQRVPFNL